MQNPVRTERRGPVLEITLDRPKVNAIDAATSRALGEAFARLRDDDTLRAGIVTGAGEKIFSAGWDLKAADRGEEDDADHGPGGFAGLTELWDLNKPVIAAVNGLAVGGGLELALACDLIVAAEHAEFFLPETALGLLADGGAVQRLPRRIPYNIAMELLLLGRRMDAAEAAHYGLVNTVVPGPQVMGKAREWARTLAEAAPLAVQAVKEVLRAFESLSTEKCFALMHSGKLPVYKRMAGSEDKIEGVRAFVEKRKPVFRGR